MTGEVFGPPRLWGVDMKWRKPNGAPIETNDEPATIEACERMGWKRWRSTKAEMAESEGETIEEATEET